MSDLLVYGGNQLKVNSELPKHITHYEYLQLRDCPKKHFEKFSLKNNRNEFLIERDTLLIDFMWETGGRIGDITRITKEKYNFRERTLQFHMKKVDRVITLNLTEAMCYEIMNFYTVYKGKEPFNMTPANAWCIMKKYGTMIGKPSLRPHMFRHGLGLYLMSQNIPIPVISYRLGHSSVKITMDLYMKVTSAIEKEYIDGVNLR